MRANQTSDGGSFGELDEGDDWAKSGGWRTIGGQGVRATLEE
jgi:hypothetical protein